MFQIRASHKSLGLFFLREFQLPSQRPEVSTSVGQLFRDFQLQTQHSLTAPCILNARQCRGTPPDGTLHGVAGIGAARAAGIGALPRRVVAVALHLAAVCLNRRAPRRVLWPSTGLGAGHRCEEWPALLLAAFYRADELGTPAGQWRTGGELHRASQGQRLLGLQERLQQEAEGCREPPQEKRGVKQRPRKDDAEVRAEVGCEGCANWPPSGRSRTEPPKNSLKHLWARTGTPRGRSRHGDPAGAGA